MFLINLEIFVHTISNLKKKYYKLHFDIFYNRFYSKQ